jgi:hypothetical protein
MDYMIIPKKISSKEVTIEMFVDLHGKGRVKSGEINRLVEGFVNTKMQTEWVGLRLASISRSGVAAPPEQMIRRGTIEEILGAELEQ